MAIKSNKIGSDNPKPRAERIFTDRVEPKEAFLKALENLNQKDYSVLAFYGVGGIGKTGLKEHFWDMIQKDEKLKNKIIYSYYDFEKDQNFTPSEVYKKLADRFSINFKVKFNAFSLAYLIYLKKQNPNFEFKKETLPFLEEGDIISSAVMFISENAGSVAELATKLVGYLYKKFADIINPTLKTELEKLEIKEHYEIGQELPRFFAYDLEQFKDKNPDKKVVIFLDTYELLCKKQKNDGDTLKQDEWVRNFIAQNEKILFVIGGRERLIWDLDDEDGNEWNKYLDQHILEELSSDDCRYFLNNCGITDTKIQDNIIKCSCGVPFYLDICVEIYESNNGAENFENLKQNKVAERLLRYLDRSERATLELLSVANYFDKEIFKLIIDKFSTGYPATMINELAKFSFISQDDGRYYIQRLMKECLKNQCDTELKSEVHKLLFGYFNAKLSDLSVQTACGYYMEFINEAFYHKENIDGIESAIDWLLEKFKIYLEAGVSFHFIDILLNLSDRNIDYGLGVIFSYLGIAYTNIANYTKAIKYYFKALEINKRIFGENHPDTAAYYNNLGVCYESLGDYRTAINYHLKALKIKEEIFGENDPDTASSYNNLGNCYISLEDYDKAITYHLKALEIRKEIFGENHPNTATSYNNLGACYYSLEDYDTAINYYLKALEIRKEKFGENHPDTAGSYNNLGNCYDYDKAIKYYLKALEIKKEIFGENHPDTARSYGNLGLCYKSLGDYNKAIEYYLQSLKIFKEFFGENHPDIATSYNNLGNCYKSLEDYDTAINYYLKALEITKEKFGENHPGTAASYNNLGACYGSLGDYYKAEDHLLKALKIKEEIFGENDPDTASSYNNLGTFYGYLGDYDKAIKYFLKALEIRKKIFGENHLDTAAVYTDLGVCYDFLEDYSTAINYCSKALNIYEMLDDDNNVKILKQVIEELKQRL
ncbi:MULTISPECIES: tetratricopeptide repeat protein [unclassified Campylobacter]|uniref:tetratricopeptide repeat protein n=1 Tax=unclassified Campylobacter TaxID=2593542 RepID=UPI0022E9FE30|nr:MULTISPECIES: tetratricopeptide repeat protein [unclassified Campylobacter]MDA3043671.1 tetratricopeptide repeat protein [Campylobacter sp. JMF_09 ED2]MDA3045411.1 tetratricopeptide repeat protein [Campylobacter sp. JMF_07 ED4]MDA3064563.1 tetratricopeptide repeat protein [Campylobacter sp. JMF_11 EL3]MDA3072486.1 tetratricopeptide repeat protein [Campylobacter sp. VBCF_03 NA9]MDA3075539.1 tetratricopeptide repeat protein [Campylobacter sp. JMF_05 ED3]